MEADLRLSGHLTIGVFNDGVTLTTGASTYPTNVPVHQIHPVKELQATRYVDQLQNDGC